MQSTPNETANTTPIDDASYLSPEQKQLATDTFQTQVQPLREGFDERVTTRLEKLARQGIAMGDLGSSSLADIFKEQTKAEAQLASQIGTGIGAKSLDQAFQSAEAAKQREFLTGERLGGEEFRTGERLGTQDFQTSEASLDREARINELNVSQEDKKELLELNSDLEQEMLDLKNSFTTSEREAIQEYESAYRDQNFANQFDLIKYQDQQRRFDLADERLLQAIQAGQVYNRPQPEDFNTIPDGVDEDGNPKFKLDQEAYNAKVSEVTNARNAAVSELLGEEGLQFTPLEEVQLQRMASNAGLTVEEYTNVRNALGGAQSAFILEQEDVVDEDGNTVTVFKNLDKFIRNPEAEREFQKELADIAGGKNDQEKLLDKPIGKGFKTIITRELLNSSDDNQIYKRPKFSTDDYGSF